MQSPYLNYLISCNDIIWYLLQLLDSGIEFLFRKCHLVDLFSHILDRLLLQLHFSSQIVTGFLQMVQIWMNFGGLINAFLIFKLFWVVVIVPTDHRWKIIGFYQFINRLESSHLLELNLFMTAGVILLNPIDRINVLVYLIFNFLVIRLGV